MMKSVPPLLAPESLAAVHAAAVQISADRRVLVQDIDPTFVATFPIMATPAEQHLVDLNTLNTRSDSLHPLPLEIWLRNAHRIAGVREESIVFEHALKAIGAQVSRVPGPPPPVEPASPPSPRSPYSRFRLLKPGLATIMALVVAALSLWRVQDCSVRQPPPKDAGVGFGSRLLRLNGRLYVTQLPDYVARASFLHVYDRETSKLGERLRIGLAILLDPSDGRAIWFCTPDEDLGRSIEDALDRDGLPVEVMPADHELRFTDCAGAFRAIPSRERPGGVLVRLQLGRGDGVRVGHRYELLGPSLQLLHSRESIFGVIGHCRVEAPADLTDTHTDCTLEVEESAAIVRGRETIGHARLESRTASPFIPGAPAHPGNRP